MKENSNALAMVKKDVVDIVTSKVREFTSAGELHFPANYSVENAMKSAWLILQETVAKTADKKEVPALTYCTRDSIANALLDMAVMGLNPAKKQCYFIAYGNKLVCQKSYFGNIYLAKLADPEIEDVIGQVVYEGDTFEYYIHRGKTFIRQHVQKLDNVDKKRIVAAYATVIRKDGDESKEYSNIMTFEEIKQAWRQSKMYPVDDKGNIKSGSTHDKFTADMAEKTVINGMCKKIINTSTDSYLVLEHYKKTEDAIVAAEVVAEIDEKGNQEIIDITPTNEPEVMAEYDVDTETGEVMAEQVTIGEGEDANF
jgi:recombination protein RecT